MAAADGIRSSRRRPAPPDRKGISVRMSGFLGMAAAAALAGGVAAAPVGEKEYRDLVEAAKARPRRIMHNNDGCDALYYPKELPLTRENFLAQRISFTAGIVDTIVYCPISSGFGHFTVELEHGDFLVADSSSGRNIASEVRDRGEDIMQWIIDFAREHDQEVFFSFRVNDTHDRRHTEKKPSIFFNPWKDHHRDLLFGEDPTRLIGNWTAVDFDREEVRRKLLDMVGDVLDKYDIDGIEFDFSRYPPLFKSRSEGKPMTDEQRDKLTQLFREIRARVDAKGRERGRAILISMTLPDSVEFCRSLGIDLELWLREGLLDIFSQMESHRLNPTSRMAELVHRYNVKFYAQLGYPYPHEHEEKTRLSRSVPEAYHARAMAAFAAGADGLLYADVTSEKSVRSAMRIDPEFLRTADKRYFVTPYYWESPRGHIPDGERFVNAPMIIGRSPLLVSPGYPARVFLEIGDELEALEAGEDYPEIIAWSDGGGRGDSGEVRIFSNNLEWQRDGGDERYRRYLVPRGALRRGLNELTIIADNPGSTRRAVRFALSEADGSFRQKAFKRLHDASRRGEKAEADGYRVTGENGRLVTLYYPELARGNATSFQFECRVIRATDDMAVVFRAADFLNYELVGLMPDRVKLHNSGVEIPVDATRFHRYELEFIPGELRFKIDGREVFRTTQLTPCDTPEAEIPFCRNADYRMNTQGIMLGSLSPDGAGEAIWRNVEVGSLPGGSMLTNLMVEIRFGADAETK